MHQRTYRIRPAAVVQKTTAVPTTRVEGARAVRSKVAQAGKVTRVAGANARPKGQTSRQFLQACTATVPFKPFQYPWLAAPYAAMLGHRGGRFGPIAMTGTQAQQSVTLIIRGRETRTFLIQRLQPREL